MADIIIIENKPLADDEFRAFCSLISPDRVKKLNSYLKYDDKTRSLHATLLARCLINKSAHFSNKQIVIKTTEYGKPYVNLPDLYFNVSHSGNYICCIIDKNYVGVDIEEVRSYDEAITNRFYTKEEIELIKYSPIEKREDLFYQIWTVKEAYLKYLGVGFHKSLTSFSVDISNEKHIKIIDPMNITNNLIIHIKPFKNYYIASVSLSDTTYEFWDNNTYNENLKLYLR